MNAYYTAADHLALLPALLLCLFGSAVLLLDLFVRTPAQRRWLLAFSVAGIAFAAAALWQQHRFLSVSGQNALTAFQGALVADRFSIFFNGLFTAASLLTVLASFPYLRHAREAHGEYFGLLLFAQAGMYFLAAGTSLVTLFLGLELMALSFYVLVGFHRADRRSNEAAMKYLLLGGFSSGFLLYGFSLLYGLTGSISLRDIGVAVSSLDRSSPVLFVAVAATCVGLLFKIAAVPFHMWAPDAYEGAPTPVAAFLSVASKAAAFAFLLRMFLGPLAELRALWEPILLAAAVASLTIGNLAALSQTSIKRLLAYSSISHAGYMLLGLIAGNEAGVQGIAVYLLVYVFMNLGVFLLLAMLRRREEAAEHIDDLEGLADRHPAYAWAMLLFLLSLAGIPPTAGFLGKYYIFLALIQAQRYVLAAVAALYVAVSLYYYFRIVRAMFLAGAAGEASVARGAPFRVALAANAAMTAGVGLYPEPFLKFARTLTGGGA